MTLLNDARFQPEYLDDEKLTYTEPSPSIEIWPSDISPYGNVACSVNGSQSLLSAAGVLSEIGFKEYLD